MILNPNDRQEVFGQYILIVMNELKVKNINGFEIVSAVMEDFSKMGKQVEAGKTAESRI